MTGIILAVIGIILTFLFGVYSIIVNRKKKKNVSLSFEKEECYSLFKKDINRLNIDINYKGKTVDSYLILFKGIIRNNGEQDIDKNRIYKPIQIKIDKEFKWLEINITSSPDGANVNIKKINDNLLELNLDLIKKDEDIEFEALIEIPQETEIEEITDEFYKSIKFDFRITDLNRIEKIDDYYSKERIQRRKNIMYSIVGFITLIFGLFALFSQQISTYFLVLNQSKTEIEYKLISKKDTTLAFISTENENLIVECNKKEKKYL